MARWYYPQGGAGGASVTVSATSPEEPADGDLWFDSTDATMYIWYVDGESGSWVQVSGSGGAGAQFDQLLLPGA
jgi:hypothetical protein